MNQHIRIALIGAVSAGKSTLLNALLVARYSDMSMQRTTANEIIYYETDDDGKSAPLADIHAQNQAANRKIMDMTEKGGVLKITDIERIEYFVPRVHKLLDGKLKPGVRLAIHDLPGLNDSKTADVYHPYVINNFYQYDIILFVVDVISALNTSDEKAILNLILKGIIDNKEKHGIETELMVIINKCDEMDIIDKNSHEARPINDEYKSMVDQVRNIINDTAKTMKMTTPIRFVCLSAEDAYIYRMYQRDSSCVIDPKHRNKFGVNEFGKNQWNKMDETKKNEAFKKCMTRENIAGATELAGFTYFDWMLAQILTHEKQFVYLINHLRFEVETIKMIATTAGDSINNELEQFVIIRDKLATLCIKYNKKMNECGFFQDKFTAFLSKFYAINAQYLIPLKPAHNDLTTYTVSNFLSEMLGSIISKFKIWTNRDHTEKFSIVKENIDKFLWEVIICRTTSQCDIAKTLNKFNSIKMYDDAVIHFCTNLCHYDFIKDAHKVFPDDEMATKFISIIKQLMPRCTAINWCEYICKNILIVIDWERTMGVVCNVDPFIMIQIFDKYHIHNNVRTLGAANSVGYDIKQQLSTIKKWALENIGKNKNGIRFPSLLLDFCLNKLNEEYPKHIVNLDVFYGVPREFADATVDEFYASTPSNNQSASFPPPAYPHTQTLAEKKRH